MWVGVRSKGVRRTVGNETMRMHLLRTEGRDTTVPRAMQTRCFLSRFSPALLGSFRPTNKRQPLPQQFTDPPPPPPLHTKRLTSGAHLRNSFCQLRQVESGAMMRNLE